MRKEYEMSEEDYKAILNASKPVPLMYLSGGTPMGGTPQGNANLAWERLGKKMGFKYMTVRPSDKGPRFFTAEPSEEESFTNQKPFAVTKERLETNWGGRGLELFRCYLCGHKFKLGDVARWIFTNLHPQLPPGNPFVCESCDGEDVHKRMALHHAEAESDKWWYYRERERQ